MLVDAFEQEIQKMVDARIATMKEGEAKGYLERAQKAEAQLHALTLICGTSDANKFQSWVDREREKVRVLRDALERRHTEQGYHRQYVDDVLDATKEASK
jgi:uncharacterized Ntn-hydrolase superfamily protein